MTKESKQRLNRYVEDADTVIRVWSNVRILYFEITECLLGTGT